MDSGHGLENKKESLKSKINKSLERMDLLLKENFELRRTLVFERKKYNDLNIAYADLKSSFHEASVAMDAPARSVQESGFVASNKSLENID